MPWKASSFPSSLWMCPIWLTHLQYPQQLKWTLQRTNSHTCVLYTELSCYTVLQSLLQTLGAKHLFEVSSAMISDNTQGLFWVDKSPFVSSYYLTSIAMVLTCVACINSKSFPINSYGTGKVTEDHLWVLRQQMNNSSKLGIAWLYLHSKFRGYCVIHTFREGNQMSWNWVWKWGYRLYPVKVDGLLASPARFI